MVKWSFDSFFSWPFLRSLVALSLILSMLLFKPAPIYILDEVDAALDLSHTQNIGQMLHTHFTHSQVRTRTNVSVIVSVFVFLKQFSSGQY